MAYVIKDIEKKYWLGIDRVMNNNTYEVTTVVEPIHSYRAATKFSSIEACKEIMDIIKEEGNYDIVYAIENTEELDKKENEAKEKEETQDKISEALAEFQAQGISPEEIMKKLSEGKMITPKEE